MISEVAANMRMYARMHLCGSKGGRDEKMTECGEFLIFIGSMTRGRSRRESGGENSEPCRALCVNKPARTPRRRSSLCAGGLCYCAPVRRGCLCPGVWWPNRA